MKRFFKLSHIITICFFICVLALMLIGKITFGYGLGDIRNLFYIIIWLVVLVISFTLTEKWDFGNFWIIALFWVSLLFFSIGYTIYGFTYGRGGAYEWNGKIFNETYNDVMEQKDKKLNDELSTLDSLIKLYPNDEKNYIKKGILYRKNRKDIESIMEFEKAQKINRNSFDAFYECGYVYRLNNDYKNAIRCYEEASRIEPQNNRVKDILKSLREQHKIYD